MLLLTANSTRSCTRVLTYRKFHSLLYPCCNLWKIQLPVVPVLLLTENSLAHVPLLSLMENSTRFCTRAVTYRKFHSLLFPCCWNHATGLLASMIERALYTGEWYQHYLILPTGFESQSYYYDSCTVQYKTQTFLILRLGCHRRAPDLQPIGSPYKT